MSAMSLTAMLTASVLLLTTPSTDAFQFPTGESVPWVPYNQTWSPNMPTSTDAVNFYQGVASAPQASPDIGAVIAQGITQMTLDLDNAVSALDGKTLQHGGDANTVFSPVSIAMVLALVMAGASGQTLTEVKRVLGVDVEAPLDVVHERFGALLAAFDKRDGSPTTTTATGIFVQQDYPIRERYTRIGKDVYKSDVIPLDFIGRNGNAANMINRWVEWRTQSRIKGFLTRPPSRDTKVLLASALYFNGEWEHPFPIATSQVRPFFVNGPYKNGTNAEVLQVTMMANALEVPYHSDPQLGCKIVSLPYKGLETAMHIVLPDERGVEGLNSLKARMTAPLLEQLIARTQVLPTIIALPRMKLESTFSLRSALETLGLRSLFDPRRSDLSQLSPGIRNNDVEEMSYPARKGRGETSNPGLYATDAFHKAEVEVTETGTVASAATAISLSRDGGHRVMRMDRPFLFFIRNEKTKLILFWGAVVRPTFRPRLFHRKPLDVEVATDTLSKRKQSAGCIGHVDDSFVISHGARSGWTTPPSDRDGIMDGVEFTKLEEVEKKDADDKGDAGEEDEEEESKCYNNIDPCLASAACGWCCYSIVMVVVNLVTGCCSV